MGLGLPQNEGTAGSPISTWQQPSWSHMGQMGLQSAEATPVSEVQRYTERGEQPPARAHGSSRPRATFLPWTLLMESFNSSFHFPRTRLEKPTATLKVKPHVGEMLMWTSPCVVERSTSGLPPRAYQRDLPMNRRWGFLLRQYGSHVSTTWAGLPIELQIARTSTVADLHRAHGDRRVQATDSSTLLGK
ncbi:hypothetical protein K458DRAFT_392509 [Lentithecium fluviatile CBS 122367]|uniref:Uncharacterized protein n=1 Tax=Lentithecium fluviatile CBS 122367 TaxID=1168545 RepID=A0A6G1ISJ1_9PLEO|nr:hypothetical protein K458DRAFT_392509 [Lentithecium fluviatile CBS 122367]